MFILKSAKRNVRDHTWKIEIWKRAKLLAKVFIGKKVSDCSKTSFFFCPRKICLIFDKMCITKPWTHLHPAPSTSTQLISASTQLSATPSTLLEPKYCTQLGNFPKFSPKNWTLSIFTENWHTWYLGGADIESRLFEIPTPKFIFVQTWA